MSDIGGPPFQGLAGKHSYALRTHEWLTSRLEGLARIDDYIARRDSGMEAVMRFGIGQPVTRKEDARFLSGMAATSGILISLARAMRCSCSRRTRMPASARSIRLPVPVL